MSAWLDLVPSQEQATVVLGEASRGDAIDILKTHLEQVQRRGDEAPAWMLQPTLRFVAEPSATKVAARSVDASDGVPQAVGTARFKQADGEDESSAHIGGIGIDSGVVKVTAVLDPDARRVWGTGALRVHPVHLRAFGYPLVGVRLMASHLGRSALLDGLIDVAQETANEVFTALSKDLRLDLELRSEGSSSAVSREVSAGGLERNAALCLESARAELATGEYPRDAFEKGMLQLAKSPMDDRMKQAEHGLAVGDYRFLISPRETAAALDHLSKVSEKDNLARLLEVDGFSVEEYEAIRKRVLKASVENGLCAPRRFWRRIIASGLAKSPADYADQLATNRAAMIEAGEDLEADRVQAEWDAIHEMCRRKGVPIPDPVREALGLPEEETPLRPRGNPTMSAAGEIGAKPTGGNGVQADQLRQRLLQPEQRVAAATEALTAGTAYEEVFTALDTFSPADLIGVLPTVAEMGSAAVPALTKLLRSQTTALRQASALVLGLSRDEGALAPLCELLAHEQTEAWKDVAAAIGSFGETALPHLCAWVSSQSTRIGEPEMARVARAMAEVALDRRGLAAVTALEKSGDETIAFSARHALATLNEVRAEADQVRGGGVPATESAEQAFARQAYEAVSVPEVEFIEESNAAVLEEGDLEFI
jgi:hypothetical protein